MNNLTRLGAAMVGAVQSGHDPDGRIPDAGTGTDGVGTETRAGSRAEAVLAAVARDLGLSPRELVVLTATSRGGTTKEIAFALQLSTKTVETYWERMFRKLHCGSKVEAMALLFRRACSVVLSSGATGVADAARRDADLVAPAPVPNASSRSASPRRR